MNCQIVIYYYFIYFTVAFAKNKRIVGGLATNIQEYPFQVSFRRVSQNLHFCGGTTVSHKHVISSAHCFIDRNGDYSDIRVYTGSDSPVIIVGEYKIQKIIIHPHFTGKLNKNEAFVNDISIITTRRSIKFNQYTNKAELPIRDIRVGDEVAITGFGKLNSTSTSLSDTLKKATMRIIDSTSCNKSLKLRIQRKQGCIQNQEGIGACHGDSGGPVTINGTLIGIMSFVVPCAQNYPDVFLRAYPYLDFILSIVEN